VNLVRYADRPDLRAIRQERLSRRTFPTYMHHNQSGTRYWGRLYDEHPDFQLDPLIPIERYMDWRRPVADWEEWTGMRFPEDGTYVFPGALAPLEVRGGVGRHVEPNVWVVHKL
jgi:hypothetical protein